MSHQLLISTLILSPLIGFLINGLRYKRHSANVAGGVATAAAAISFLSAILIFMELLAMPKEGRQIAVNFFEWMTVASLKINMGFLVDPLNVIMILIITGVGSLIHLFSVSYMHHDEGAAKYFAYLNLFLFNMLVLVLGDNLLVMFVGWEGVGLCSYLLIGFWFKDSDKAAAGMKAFVTNRVGDAAFLLGMFLLFVSFGTLNFQEINNMVPADPTFSWLSPLTLGTLFLFIGATGKSAQIPLYVWLPDAMAGPTPVSALIHAATMVTAGVYMIIRLNPLFLHTPNTMLVIAIIGGLTAVMAASIGLTQWDIKKVLAYSTVSQLGYMFLAVGVGAFTAGLFHLMTHAFFKALMFLGSGSVIHAMHEEQDIRKMGGLKKHMPITHFTFLIGWLAIIGMPPFSGFFSKDEILWLSFHSPLGHPALWALGAVGAVMTAFYMTRLMALTFWGKSRVPQDVHPHESPALMTIPLIVLAILSAFAGWLGVPHVIGAALGHLPNILAEFLSLNIKPIPNLAEANVTTEIILMSVSVGFALISAALAYHMYVRNPELPGKFTEKVKGLHNFVYNKYFVDEAYEGSIIQPLVQTSKSIWFYVDVNFIDKATYWISDIIKGGGSLVRSLQNGNLQTYAMYVAIGLVMTLTFILVR
ncbi:MAG: NADH-quinone oxidoreductase subunit L [Proteobacteria bacterium]|jgi:NADH-quinone oxidoreductase subunit L|nr:NADH-quinone oxidoreductase subunit L [Pseudomonadota bacterium]